MTKKKLLLSCVLYTLTITMLLLTSCASKSSHSERHKLDAKIQIADQRISSLDTLFRENFNEHIGQKYLVSVEIEYNGYDSIISGNGNYKFIYYELLSESGSEGGTVSTTTIYYNNSLSTVDYIDTFYGSGKAGGYGGSELSLLKWNYDFYDRIEQFIKNHMNEIATAEDPIVSIRIKNNIADMFLFTVKDAGYSSKETINLT